MAANIEEIELQILTWMHEHAEGFGEDYQFEPDHVANELKMERKLLNKCLSYLDAHGLVGMDPVSTRDDFLIPGVWLTGVGEDYMRALEREPSIARKLTVGGVKELWEMGKGPLATRAAIILAEFWQHFRR